MSSFKACLCVRAIQNVLLTIAVYYHPLNKPNTGELIIISAMWFKLNCIDITLLYEAITVVFYASSYLLTIYQSPCLHTTLTTPFNILAVSICGLSCGITKRNHTHCIQPFYVVLTPTRSPKLIFLYQSVVIRIDRPSNEQQ